LADGKKLDEAAMAKRDIVDAPEVTQGMEQEAEVKAEAVQKAVEQAVEPSLDVAKAASVFSEVLAAPEKKPEIQDGAIQYHGG